MLKEDIKDNETSVSLCIVLKNRVTSINKKGNQYKDNEGLTNNIYNNFFEIHLFVFYIFFSFIIVPEYIT